LPFSRTKGVKRVKSLKFCEIWLKKVVFVINFVAIWYFDCYNLVTFRRIFMKKFLLALIMVFLTVSVFSIDFWYYDKEGGAIIIFKVDTFMKKYSWIFIGDELAFCYEAPPLTTTVTQKGDVYTVSVKDGITHIFSLLSSGEYEHLAIDEKGVREKKENVFELKRNKLPGLTKVMLSYLSENSAAK
jgi:hypothetical protein